MSLEGRVSIMASSITGDMPDDIKAYTYESMNKELGIDDRGDLIKFRHKLESLMNNPKGSAYVQLMQWRKLADQMIKICHFYEKTAQDAYEQLERVQQMSMDRANKRWSDEEDTMLIELICEEKHSIIELATVFGRTPSALKSRVSHLVGIKKLSQEVAGKFIGTFDGIKVEGDIKGTVIKE